MPPPAKTLRPIRPNASVRLRFQRSLEALIDEMWKSCLYWLTAQYRATPPKTMASDENAAKALEREMRRLGTQWEARFDELARQMAKRFTDAAGRHSDAALMDALKGAGFSVKWKMTPAMQEAMAATIEQQVGLIRTIPQEFLSDVQGLVMRSVQTGRDIGTLTTDLHQRYDITRRRAAFIARDQNSKATATLTRVRQSEAGITKARWLHSAAGKKPRPEHVAFSKGRLGGPIYDVAKGAYLENRWTWPGYEINCRCVSVPVVEGFT